MWTWRQIYERLYSLSLTFKKNEEKHLSRKSFCASIKLTSKAGGYLIMLHSVVGSWHY